MKNTKILFSLVGFMLICASVTPAFAVGRYESYSGTGIRKIEINGSFVSIEMKGYLGSRTEITPVNLPPQVAVTYQKVGRTLYVKVKRKGLFLSNKREGLLQISLPDTVETNIETSSGTISVQNMRTDSVYLHSSSGSIVAQGIKTSLEARSSSGSITLQDFKGEAALLASSGVVHVREMDGPLSVETSSGSQELRQVRGDIEAKASSGTIRVVQSRGAVDIKSSSGSIVAEGVTLRGDCFFESSSGSIGVDFTNPISDFAFSLLASSGSLKAGDVSGQRTLTVGEGPYKIVGKSSSGSQSYQ